MAKLAILAVFASLLGVVSCEFSIYLSYGYRPPNSGMRPYRPLLPASPPQSSTTGLKVGYYADKNCSQAEKIVREAVSKASPGDKAGLIRLFFHDCFVQGCDASVLLDGSNTEKMAFPNLSLRGYEVIDAAKAALEKECPGVVSCADIVAFAGRDASYDLSYNGINYGINYAVPAGRLDGKVSHDFETFSSLPPPFANLSELTILFGNKGLSPYDMVVLSGAHSIGRSNCTSFEQDRLPPAGDNSSNTAMDSELSKKLFEICNASKVNVDQDLVTPYKLDVQYYKNILNNEVLFTSDATLTTSSKTEDWVKFFAGKLLGTFVWNHAFGEAMVKMGNIGLKNSTEGEIRKECRSINIS